MRPCFVSAARVDLDDFAWAAAAARPVLGDIKLAGVLRMNSLSHAVADEGSQASAAAGYKRCRA